MQQVKVIYTPTAISRKWVLQGFDSVRIVAAGGELALFIHDMLHMRIDESSDTNAFHGMTKIKEYLEEYFAIRLQFGG